MKMNIAFFIYSNLDSRSLFDKFVTYEYTVMCCSCCKIHRYVAAPLEKGKPKRPFNLLRAVETKAKASRHYLALYAYQLTKAGGVWGNAVL